MIHMNSYDICCDMVLGSHPLVPWPTATQDGRVYYYNRLAEDMWCCFCAETGTTMSIASIGFAVSPTQF